MFDYTELLKYTQRLHPLTAHIMLDTFQISLQVTFPAVEPPDQSIEAAEAFARGRLNCTTNRAIAGAFVRDALGDQAAVPQGELEGHYAVNAAFDQFVANWRHYVISPSHPYTFLDPECPCSFFGA